MMSIAKILTLLSVALFVLAVLAIGYDGYGSTVPMFSKSPSLVLTFGIVGLIFAMVLAFIALLADKFEPAKTDMEPAE